MQVGLGSGAAVRAGGQQPDLALGSGRLPQKLPYGNLPRLEAARYLGYR